MRRSPTLIVLILLAMVACTGPSQTAAPIASTTRFEASRFAGPWVMRHALGPDAPRALSFEADQEQVTALRYIDGTGQRLAFSPAENTPHRARFSDAAGQAYWVLWVDDDYRTALLGAPDRRFAWVIDRNPTGGADRIEAALRLARANGYTPEAFTPYQP